LSFIATERKEIRLARLDLTVLVHARVDLWGYASLLHFAVIFQPACKKFPKFNKRCWKVHEHTNKQDTGNGNSHVLLFVFSCPFSSRDRKRLAYS